MSELEEEEVEEEDTAEVKGDASESRHSAARKRAPQTQKAGE